MTTHTHCDRCDKVVSAVWRVIASASSGHQTTWELCTMCKEAVTNFITRRPDDAV